MTSKVVKETENWVSWMRGGQVPVIGWENVASSANLYSHKWKEMMTLSETYEGFMVRL